MLVASEVAVQPPSEHIRHDHIGSLQSLRGVAAMIVVVHHCLIYFRTPPVIHLAAEAIFNAHGAVVFFFVLSGFVLTRALSMKPIAVKTLTIFFIRRVFRIYPALFIAAASAVAYVLLARSLGPDDAVAPSFRALGVQPLGAHEVLGTFAGISTLLLPPLWSIRVELYGSLIVPILAFVVTRAPRALPLIAVMMIVPTLLFDHIGRIALTYLIYFAFGATTILWVRRWPTSPTRSVHIVLAVLALFGARWMNPAWRFGVGYNAVVPGLVEGLASAVLIYAAVTHRLFQAALTGPMLERLGNISFSLYLLHFPVLCFTGLAFDRLAPEFVGTHPTAAAMLLVATVIGIVIPLSVLSYRFVELAGIKLGSHILRSPMLRH